jgi:Icc-related predicted phosphoesterase
MRCHYMSDLHLESQGFAWRLPKGDVLIIAGDLCHARCLDPARTDKYSVDQRHRVRRFIDSALANFAHVLLIAGNHDHYDGVFEEAAALFRRHLPGVTVLDDEAVEIDGTRFFGTTLWSDFDGRNTTSMNGVRRRMGEYFFVKTRVRAADGQDTLAKFQPEHALAAHDKAWAALSEEVRAGDGQRRVVISHHAPSRHGLNPQHAGNGLDGAYASDLDKAIGELGRIDAWIHGHTHIRRVYRIGQTSVHVNCRGFDGKEISARTFTPIAFFE